MHPRPSPSPSPPLPFSPPTTILHKPTPFLHPHHLPLLPHIARLHANIITQDAAISSFLPPITPSKQLRMLEFWRGKVEDMVRGERVMLLVFAERSSEDLTGGEATPKDATIAKEKETEAYGEWQGPPLAAYITLSTPSAASHETTPHVASVEKLAVDPMFRGRGFAKQLMCAVEDVARDRGRVLLMVNTETDSPASTLYRRLGYTVVGTIPKHRISPQGGEFRGTIFFYKDLRDVVGVEEGGG